MCERLPSIHIFTYVHQWACVIGVCVRGRAHDIISRFMNVFNVTRTVEGNMFARVLRSITYGSVKLAIKAQRSLGAEASYPKESLSRSM